MAGTSYARSIDIPVEVFKNLKNAKRFALDIGGSLTKLAYYSTMTKRKAIILESSKTNGGEIYHVSEEDELRDQLHFIKFETKYIETCVDFIQQNLIGSKEFQKGKIMKVTGGGAFKYKDLLCSKLGVQVDKEDEMECSIKGTNFLLKNIPDEAFIFQRRGNPDYHFQTSEPDAIFPYLLVNIGSGVSILKVEGEDKYERIGGTSMGGGTFWGLGSILTKAKGFDELLELADKGDHRNVDMRVKDIYGGSYDVLGLPAELIASSFGKAARCTRDKHISEFRDSDIAKSLLITVSNDIGQIALLNARLHGLKKIYFGGYFIRGHPLTMHTITYAINYWSKGEIQALFLRHEGYLGAVGAFLKAVEEEDAETYSWTENYAGSVSSIPSPNSTKDMIQQGTVTFDVLELDKFTKSLVTCPLLLDPASYVPDTEELTHDEPARKYWLQCFEDAMDKFVMYAVKSQPNQEDAKIRAERFKDKYICRLQELRENPCAYGSLTVRSLLDTREHCMEEFHFVDPYSQQKQIENEQALRLLGNRFSELDAMNWEECQLSLAEGMIAGNVFDWGAKEVATLLETTNFGFVEAMAKLPARPWLFDDFDEWKARLKEKPYKCAAIFVDNSGMDIIMGIFPITRELLKLGTSVILCANSRPALNDVTYHELTILAKRVSAMSDIILSALSDGRLLIMESGQGSPCLDLRYIDYDLAEKMREMGTDLLVLEGMGRAVHTNLTASFKSHCLKVAVLKNPWLARRLGSKMFGVIFKYERARYVTASTGSEAPSQSEVPSQSEMPSESEVPLESKAPLQSEASC